MGVVAVFVIIGLFMLYLIALRYIIKWAFSGEPKKLDLDRIRRKIIINYWWKKIKDYSDDQKKQIQEKSMTAQQIKNFDFNDGNFILFYGAHFSAIKVEEKNIFLFDSMTSGHKLQARAKETGKNVVTVERKVQTVNDCWGRSFMYVQGYSDVANNKARDSMVRYLKGCAGWIGSPSYQRFVDAGFPLLDTLRQEITDFLNSVDYARGSLELNIMDVLSLYSRTNDFVLVDDGDLQKLAIGLHKVLRPDVRDSISFENLKEMDSCDNGDVNNLFKIYNIAVSPGITFDDKKQKIAEIRINDLEKEKVRSQEGVLTLNSFQLITSLDGRCYTCNDYEEKPELLYHSSLADIENLGDNFFEEEFVKTHDQEKSLKELEWEEARLIAPIIKKYKPNVKFKKSNYREMVFTLSQSREIRDRIGHYNARGGA